MSDTGGTVKKSVKTLMDEATAPIRINDTLSKLCKRYDPLLVMAEVEKWLDYMRTQSGRSPQ